MNWDEMRDDYNKIWQLLEEIKELDSNPFSGIDTKVDEIEELLHQFAP